MIVRRRKRKFRSLYRCLAIRLALAVAAGGIILCSITACTGNKSEKSADIEKVDREKVAKSKAGKLEKKDTVNPYGASAPPGKAITKTEMQAVDASGREKMDDAIICLARTIYWEARGTDKAVMQAVANVVMNRLGHERFPDTICAIVKQGQAERNCQFSWWCDGRPDSAQEKKPYETAKEIARKALNRQLKDLTGGALYFHSRGVKPVWAKKLIRTVKIGKFNFYKPRKELGVKP